MQRAIIIICLLYALSGILIGVYLVAAPTQIKIQKRIVSRLIELSPQSKMAKSKRLKLLDQINVISETPKWYSNFLSLNGIARILISIGYVIIPFKLSSTKKKISLLLYIVSSSSIALSFIYAFYSLKIPTVLLLIPDFKWAALCIILDLTIVGMRVLSFKKVIKR